MAANLPSTMRAAQWTSTPIEKSLKVNNIPLPAQASSLPPDSTLVKVAYSSVNPVDYKLPELPIVGRRLNHIPCADFAGTVVSSTVSHFKPGQKVFGLTKLPAFGALADYVIAYGDQGIVALPEGVSFQDAAALGVAASTAYQCLVPYVKAGDKVFINGGSGGVGSFAIQIAKIVGCHVTTTCSGANVELCKSLGADEVINYRDIDVVDHLKRQGTQFDLLVDTASTYAIYWSAHHYLKPTGAYNMIPGGFSLSSIREMALIFNLPQFLGGGKRTPRFIKREVKAEFYEALVGWVKEGKLKTVVDKEFTLDEAAEAFTSLRTGRTKGKIIIKVAQD